MGLNIKDRFDVPQINAWELYDKIKDGYSQFDEGDVVAFSCGPLSRILIKEWFEKRPDVTFVGVGSVFDPFTRNVWHACHRGWTSRGRCETRECSVCN